MVDVKELFNDRFKVGVGSGGVQCSHQRHGPMMCLPCCAGAWLFDAPVADHQDCVDRPPCVCLCLHHLCPGGGWCTWCGVLVAVAVAVAVAVHVCVFGLLPAHPLLLLHYQDSDSKAFNFAAIWLALLVIAFGIGGTMVLMRVRCCCCCCCCWGGVGPKQKSRSCADVSLRAAQRCPLVS